MGAGGGAEADCCGRREAGAAADELQTSCQNFFSLSAAAAAAAFAAAFALNVGN